MCKSKRRFWGIRLLEGTQKLLDQLRLLPFAAPALKGELESASRVPRIFGDAHLSNQKNHTFHGHCGGHYRGSIRGRHGGVEKRGGWKTSRMTPLPKGVLDPPSYGTFSTPLRCQCSCFPVQKSTTEQTRSSFGLVPKFSGESVLWYVFLPPIRFAPPHITAQVNSSLRPKPSASICSVSMQSVCIPVLGSVCRSLGPEGPKGFWPENLPLHSCKSPLHSDDAYTCQFFRSEKSQNESSPNFSKFWPGFCPEFLSAFPPNVLRIFRASFRGKRRPEKIHQKSPPFFNAKFPGKYGKKIPKMFLERRQSNNSFKLN